MHKPLPLLLLGLLTLTAPAAAQLPPAADTFRSGEAVPAGAVAVINDDRISLQEFVDHVYLRFADHFKGTEALNDLIQLRIVDKNSRDRNIVVTAADAESEYRRLDQEHKAAANGQSLDSMLTERGLEKRAFMERLATQLALKRMTIKDFGRDDVQPADQMQWLRSKMIEAQIERETDKLPANAAARVYGDFITRSDFARNVAKLLPEADVAAVVQALMEARLADQLCALQGITIGPRDLDAQYDESRRAFQENPQFAGLNFEDFLRERTGMTVAEYKASPGFYREACRFRLGQKLIGDDEAPAYYREHQDFYGPIFVLRHIFFRGSDHPAHQDTERSMEDAKKQAEVVVEKLRRGEEFEELAKVFSEDATSKFRQGHFGEFTPRSLEQYESMASVVPTMQVGEFRGPFVSARGYHVVKLHEKKPAPPLSEAIVRDLRKRVAVDYFHKAWNEAKRGIDLRRFISER